MAKPLSTVPQRRALAVATAAALIFGAYFLRDYLTLIIFAAILAFSFNPFYQRRLKKTRKPGRAATETLLLTLTAIVIPLLLLVGLAGFQINQTIHTISSGQIDVAGLTQQSIDKANSVLASTPTDFRITPDWIKATQADAVGKIGRFLQHNAATYAGNFFNFFTISVIFIFVFLSLLKNQKTLIQVIRDLNPLGDEFSDLYTRRVSAMTKGMVRGQFVIAAAQGFADAALIFIGGLHSAFFLLFFLLTVLSFIPLGGGIIAIPIGIAMLLSGNVVGGIVVIAGHLLIVTNIDNLLRPRLVPPEAKLDSALTILSVFAGVALLGFLGIIVGPVIMIVIVTTVEAYREAQRNPAG